jgi:hypothetical protein
MNGSLGPAAFDTHSTAMNGHAKESSTKKRRTEHDDVDTHGTAMNGHANESSTKKGRTEHDKFDYGPGLFVRNENNESKKGSLDDDWLNTDINLDV